MTYDNILLASDGTDASDAALAHAIQLADDLGATVHIVYALEVAEHPPDFEDEGEHPDLKAKRERALETSTEKAEAAGIDVTPVAVRSRSSSISDTILSYVREHDIDLIVMGTHGRSGLDRVLVGSVAEDVIRSSPVPVVTARPDAIDDE